MTIRALQNEETDFLADMLYEAIFIPEGQEPLPRAVVDDPSLAKYVEDWGKHPYDLALVVEVEHQLVGAIWGRLFTAHNQGFGYVDAQTPELSMAIRPAYRNQGLGTALLKSIALEYQNMGVKQLSLSVDQANPAAALYQRLGYRIVGTHQSAWTMAKRLD